MPVIRHRRGGCFPALLGAEAIADAGFRHEPAGAGGVELELAPQLRRVDPEVMHLVIGVEAPHLAEPLALGDHLPHMPVSYTHLTLPTSDLV